jgi:hypothetical protein
LTNVINHNWSGILIQIWKYFFRIVSVLIPLLYVLYVKGKPLPKEEGEKEKKAIFGFTFSFVCLVLTLFAAILIEH